MPFEKKITWVAVLDSRKAHFFTKGPDNRLAKLNHTLKAIPSRTNIESCKALGRVHDRVGPARHIAEPHKDEQAHELQIFTENVAEYLEGSLENGRFDRLILVAPPKTLGVLRKTLSKSLKDIIALELDKNFINLAPHEIQKQLEDVVFI